MKKFLVAVSLGNALCGAVQAKNDKANSNYKSINNSKISLNSSDNTYSGATYDAAGHL